MEYKIRSASTDELPELERSINELAAEGYRIIYFVSTPAVLGSGYRAASRYTAVLQRKSAPMP